VFSDDGEGQTTAGNKPSLDFHPTWLASFNEVVQHVVDNLLVERMNVAIRREIKFEGLGFDAELVRNVLDENFGEIRLTSDWA
jgi:hypothetical protein